MTPARLADALPQVVDGLTRVHDGYGISEMRLSRWAPRLAKDWAALADSGLVPEDLHRQVVALIDRDAALRASWTHGDPVASNVIRGDDGGIVLVDWENARHEPVMVDATKLHVFAADPDAGAGPAWAGWSDIGSARVLPGGGAGPRARPDPRRSPPPGRPPRRARARGAGARPGRASGRAARRHPGGLRSAGRARHRGTVVG